MHKGIRVERNSNRKQVVVLLLRVTITIFEHLLYIIPKCIQYSVAVKLEAIPSYILLLIRFLEIIYQRCSHLNILSA